MLACIIKFADRSINCIIGVSILFAYIEILESRIKYTIKCQYYKGVNRKNNIIMHPV